MRVLIGVKDIRLASGQWLPPTPQRRSRLPSCPAAARPRPCAGPFHDSHQIEEASPHRDVGHVCTTHMVRCLDCQMPKQIRMDFVPRMRLAGLWMLIDCARPILVSAVGCDGDTNSPTVAPQLPCIRNILISTPQAGGRTTILRRG